MPFRLDALVLVCKACGKRSSGPDKHGKPKKLAQELKRAGKDARLKTRVVMTGCMGLCPRKATAVAVVADGAGPRQYAVQSTDQVAGLLPKRLPAPEA